MTAYPVVRGKPGAIASALERRNMSVRALAAAANVSHGTAGYLRLDQHPLRLDRAERIAEALGAPVADLFEHKNGDQIGGGHG